MNDGKPLTLDDLEDLDEDAKLGVGATEDFSWKGMLDFADLHRVRSLPGPVPGLEHREAALARSC